MQNRISEEEALIKLVKRYFGRYRLLIGCVLLFSLLQIMCQLILPEMTDRILRFGVAGGNISYIISIGTEMTAGVGIFMIISGYFSAKITARFTYDIRKDLFDRVKTFTTEEYGRFGAATLLTRSTADVTVMQMLMINSLRSAMLIPFTGLGAIIVAVSMNWPLTVINPYIHWSMHQKKQNSFLQSAALCRQNKPAAERKACRSKNRKSFRQATV